jgi:hypothetical protein
VDRDDPLPVAERASALPATLFLLGVASLAFDLASVLVKAPFFQSGLTFGDAIEAIGVYAVCLLYLRVGAATGRMRDPRGALLVVAALTFAFGRGIHVAANSLHDLLDRTGAGDPTGLATFWDEHVGHYLADAARIGFAVLLSSGRTSGPVEPLGRGGSLLVLTGAMAYGFIAFANSVEGRTVPLVLPFFIVYAAWAVLALVRRSKDAAPRRHGIAVRFFGTATLTALVFYAIWRIWQGGFPEFTATGLLPSAETQAAPGP